MSTNRFHKAAQDGYELIKILKEATKKECNSRDEQGMTPTLYAAFHGHVDALRLLCSRGGDPDKADFFGNTALHLAAAQGHMEVVKFLIKFGVNIYAMDIDRRTPQELAGLNNRDDILQLLDKFRGDLESEEKSMRKVKIMKEKAKKDVEKTIRKYHKYNEQQSIYQTEKERKFTSRPSIIHTLKMRVKSGSMSNLTQPDQHIPRHSFSALVSGGTMNKKSLAMGTVQRKAMARNKTINQDDDDFKISEIEDGTRSVRSINGFRRDSEVLYSGTLEDPRPHHVENIFNDAEDALDNTISGGGTLMRSKSQPDFMQQLNDNQASIFVRPGIGSFAFRKSISNAMQAMSLAEPAVDESSIGSARFDDDVDLMDSDNSDDEMMSTPMERFLTAWGLGEYLSRFEDQKIDLDILMILTENDLKTLGLPLGPHRKLVNAISERKLALENPGEVTDGMV